MTMIEGKITLPDGSESEFTVSTDNGWQQWGADKPRLGETCALMDALSAAVHEHAPNDESEE